MHAARRTRQGGSSIRLDRIHFDDVGPLVDLATDELHELVARIADRLGAKFAHPCCDFRQAHHSLGPHDVMILRNHGLVAAGSSIAKAFHNIMFLERACQAQIKALSGGRPLSMPSREVCERAGAQGADRPEVEEIAQLGWQAALRLLRPIQAPPSDTMS